MQLGVYSFGSRAGDPQTGEPATTSESVRNLLEAIRLADDVGLDYFGVGEQHSWEMPASAGATILAAAAATSSRILLGSSVTVLSTEDPVRLYQQYATVDAISNGRAEITAGRGSLTDCFPLFGLDLRHADQLYSEKLDLLLRIDASPTVSWAGSTRAPLDTALVVPRPERGNLPIWLGTGGSPGFSVRAGLLGLPVAYRATSGPLQRFSRLAMLYRRALLQGGHAEARAVVSIGHRGYVAEEQDAALRTYLEHWQFATASSARKRGLRPPGRERFEIETTAGALFVGAPEQVAERIVELHRTCGHQRHVLQMDLGRLPHRDWLRSIELLGTRVKPLLDAELGPEPHDLRGTIPAGRA